MIFMILFFLLSMSLNSYAEESSDQLWTELHKKAFSECERTAQGGKKEIMFCKKKVRPFTQLVFSWNAMRPVKGHFSFYVQVRNARTKKWGSWHRMSEWGRGVQRSYASKSDGFSSFSHVRLEIERGIESDGFRVWVKAEHGAVLSHVHALFVALSHFELFKAESRTNGIDALPSAFIYNVPGMAQFALDHEDNGRICSPVSCAMVMSYLTGKIVDPLVFAQNVYDDGLSVYGSWPFNSAHAFEHNKGKTHFFVRRFNSFSDLHRHLQQNVPVVVSVRGELPGAYKLFSHGHLLVVVGWDARTKEVVCQDPASDSHHTVLKRYKADHFLRAWERSHRLAYVAESLAKRA